MQITSDVYVTICTIAVTYVVTGYIFGFVEITDASRQVKVWTATLVQEHHKSGQPWKAEIREPTYEAARRTAAERLHWQGKCFMVAPVVENYVDVGQMSITP